MAAKKTSPRPRVVALSLRTGKPVQRPKAGALVHYAYVGPRGGIRRITRFPQTFTKTDLKTMDRIIGKSEGGQFVLYEALTRRNKRDKHGKVLYRERDGKPVLDARGRRIPLKETKITAVSKAARSRPVVFKVGRRVQQAIQDHAFRALTPREKVDLKLARIVKLTKPDGAFTKEMHVTGRTIFDTIKNLRPDVSKSELVRRGLSGLMVQGVVRVRNPKGGLVAALPFSVVVNALWNFPQLIAKEVRHSLAQVGYRFTSLAELTRLQDKADAENKSVDLFRMGPVGRSSVKTLKPIRPEGAGGRILKSGKGMDVSLSLRLTGIPGRKGGKGKQTKGKR